MKRKIAAIVAADVVGYSRLVSIEEEETISRLMMYRTHFRSVVEYYGGRIFNTAGDAILAEFQSSVDALRAATEIMEGIRNYNKSYTPNQRITFRIGMTIGDVIEKDGDLFGDAVNVAARLEGLAEPGGICLSAAIHDQVMKNVPVRFKDLGFKHLKNIPESVRVYAIHFFNEEDLNEIRSTPKAKQRRALLAALISIIVFVAMIGGLMRLYARQALDATFFTGDFALNKGDSKTPPSPPVAPVRPSAPPPKADVPNGNTISEVSEKPKVVLETLCSKFSVSAQRALEVTAVGQAKDYLERMHAGKAGFSMALDIHEAAKSLGYSQGFAVIYGELIEAMRGTTGEHSEPAIELALKQIITQREDLFKLFQIEQYRLAIAYYWVLSEAWCAFPETITRIPPTSTEFAGLFASKDITLAYPTISYQFFSAIYGDAERFISDSVKIRGFYYFFGMMNNWREFIISDAKSKHLI